MNTRHFIHALVLSSLALAACGGGGDPELATAPTTKGAFSAVVSFGDSLSDVGTYAPATSAQGDGTPPYIGGKFTTNGPGATIWLEDLASSLGLAITPAEVGFNGSSVKCPAAGADPSLARTCTAYGQGGARITDPVGIGNNGDGTGALTVPVVTQIANHLARFGSFKSSDLVLVYAGNNDVFIAFAEYAFVAESLQAEVAAGTMTPAQASAQIALAQQAAESDVETAAGELAKDVRSQILAKGGTYVAVMTLSDIADTPFGHSFAAELRPVLTDFSQVFNTALRAGLKNAPVRIVDTWAVSKEIYANPAKYGFVNNTTAACDIAKISVITGGAIDDGTSLFCNDTPGAPYNGLGAGADPISWQFADDVHPTTGGHRAIKAALTTVLQSFGWI